METPEVKSERTDWICYHYTVRVMHTHGICYEHPQSRIIMSDETLWPCGKDFQTASENEFHFSEYMADRSLCENT